MPFGCSGAVRVRRRGRATGSELLEESDQALAQVDSFRFSGRMTMSTSEGEFRNRALRWRRRAARRRLLHDDESARAAGIPETTVVVRDNEAGWSSTAAGRLLLMSGGSTGIGQFDLAQYVKDVELDEDAGPRRPAVKITGVLDTAWLFDGLLGQLGTAGAGPMPDLSDMLGDTRWPIYLPTRRRCRWWCSSTSACRSRASGPTCISTT